MAREISLWLEEMVSFRHINSKSKLWEIGASSFQRTRIAFAEAFSVATMF